MKNECASNHILFGLLKKLRWTIDSTETTKIITKLCNFVPNGNGYCNVLFLRRYTYVLFNSNKLKKHYNIIYVWLYRSKWWEFNNVRYSV